MWINVMQSSVLILMVSIIFIRFTYSHYQREIDIEPPFWIKATGVIPLLLSCLALIVSVLFLIWS
jgi:hypothetical protein